MNPQRYLCADLLTLERSQTSLIVNLEEIWESGAVIDSESPLVVQEKIEFTAGSNLFHATVISVEQQDFGWRASIEFSPLTPWTPEKFRPGHLLDVATLNRQSERP